MQNKNKKTIYLLAGEASGDLHGSGLMREIKKNNPSISFVGIGGPKMEKEGLQTLVPISKLAVMGFWEVFKKLIFFFQLEKRVLKHIKETQPSQIIMIDYPGFNLRIAQKIKQKNNLKIIYYISPQLWAWKEKRVNIIKKYIDKMIVVFPFEQEWYNKRGIHVEYFGHPIIDHSKLFNYSTTPNNKEINIALCPGSRAQEIKRHMPILSQLIIQYPKSVQKKVNFTIIQAPGISRELLKQYVSNQNVTIVNTSILESFKIIDVGVVASGTASLECSITKKPLIVIYKMSWVSWFITKTFIKIPFACITNILAGEKIIPELLQGHFTLPNLIKNLNHIVSQKEQKKYTEKINKIIGTLGNGNSYKQAANFILNND